MEYVWNHICDSITFVFCVKWKGTAIINALHKAIKAFSVLFCIGKRLRGCRPHVFTLCNKVLSCTRETRVFSNKDINDLWDQQYSFKPFLYLNVFLIHSSMFKYQFDKIWPIGANNIGSCSSFLSLRFKTPMPSAIWQISEQRFTLAKDKVNSKRC